MLKKIALLAVIGLIIQNRGEIMNIMNPQPDFSTEHGGKVILYATSWCGYCAKARELMDKNNIEYFEYDIEKSTKGYSQHKALGGSGIPVLLINEEVIKGYNPSRILSLAK